ncbi:MAG: 4'-phosphopantetheinyl transferase superfamily protein [Gammaproteobacteria bacterium]
MGCDIVSISLLQNRLAASGDLIPERVFHPSERLSASLESLAGVFAAKEAAFKALGMKAGDWLKLCVDHDDSGAPSIQFMEPKPGVREIALSISHNGDYAFAVAAAVFE